MPDVPSFGMNFGARANTLAIQMQRSGLLNATIGLIRRTIADVAGAAVARGVQIQYGGSVTPENAAELLGQSEVDGALVGGASLNADSFAAIVRAAR